MTFDRVVACSATKASFKRLRDTKILMPPPKLTAVADVVGLPVYVDESVMPGHVELRLGDEVVETVDIR